MADRIADITALADRAAAEGSETVSLKALYRELGVDQPHHLTVRKDGWSLTHGCDPTQPCPLADAVDRCLLISAPYAVGRCYKVWLDGDERLMFREVQPT